jgi:hypothetical protein
MLFVTPPGKLGPLRDRHVAGFIQKDARIYHDAGGIDVPEALKKPWAKAQEQGLPDWRDHPCDGTGRLVRLTCVIAACLR